MFRSFLTPNSNKTPWNWYFIGGVLIIVLLATAFSRRPEVVDEPSQEIAAVIDADEWRRADDTTQLELNDALVEELLAAEYEHIAFLHYQPETELDENTLPLGIAMVKIEADRTLAQITADGLEYLSATERYAVWVRDPEASSAQLLGPLIPISDQTSLTPAWELLYGTTQVWSADAEILVTREMAGDPPTQPSDQLLLFGQLNQL